MRVGGNVGIPAGVMMPERNIQEIEDQIQSADDLFGPGYEVRISEEGRKLLEGQTGEEVQEGTGVQGTQYDEKVEMLLREMEEVHRERKIRKEYYDELENEIELQIKVMNAAYGRMKDSSAYQDPLMKEAVKQQQLLQEEMQEQKDFQAEEALKRLKEAQQAAAAQTSRQKEEINENNRDLVALLRTMEKPKRRRKNRKTTAWITRITVLPARRVRQAMRYIIPQRNL